MATDLLLDRETHDIVVRRYDLQLVRDVDLIAQNIKQRLWLFLGEWYLNRNAGVPYFQEILVKGPNQTRVESIFKATIVETRGVLDLLEFGLEYDPQRRRLSVNFTVRVESGDRVADSLNVGVAI